MTQSKTDKINFANVRIRIKINDLNILIVDIPITATVLENPINNVYCVDDEGTIVWKVKASAGNYEDDPFVSLKLTADGAIKARRFFGKEYIIDKDTGIAEEIGWSK